MSTNWGLDRLKKVSLGDRPRIYTIIPEGEQEIAMAKLYPELFTFEAVSVGHERIGQAFLVPLDESSVETAELIIKAIAAYKGE